MSARDFGCCGGNEEAARHPPRPQHHCSDCDEHPWTALLNPKQQSLPLPDPTGATFGRRSP